MTKTGIVSRRPSTTTAVNLENEPLLLLHVYDTRTRLHDKITTYSIICDAESLTNTFNEKLRGICNVLIPSSSGRITSPAVIKQKAFFLCFVFL